jgi:hypothetical protein
MSAAQLPEALDQSRETAATIVKNMYRLVDWDVGISWQDRSSTVPSSTTAGKSVDEQC